MYSGLNKYAVLKQSEKQSGVPISFLFPFLFFIFFLVGEQDVVDWWVGHGWLPDVHLASLSFSTHSTRQVENRMDSSRRDLNNR